MSSYSISAGLKNTLRQTTLLAYDEPIDSHDIIIKFLSAENLPKMDTIGHADPYFVARIDDHAIYTSSVVSNTSAPQWTDEEWIVRNIPCHARLFVVLFDKDNAAITDDYIGQFEVLNLINYHAPIGGHNIVNLHGHNKGQFHMSILSEQSSEETKQLPRYTFDGPCRYFRHTSNAVGHLTMLNADCVYYTWKIPMKRITVFFPPYERQHWNRQYQAARSVFGQSPLSLTSRGVFRLAHKALHKGILKHDDTGRVNTGDDLWKYIFTNKTMKPCVYTYVIDDDSWRFSETGQQFVTDFASKHVLLANCSKYVRYAGEFHPRPKYGWNRLNDEWELVFDNGSGTYSPSVDLLKNLKALLMFNFPGLNVVTYDYKDRELKQSMERLKIAAKNHKDSA